MQLTCLSPGMRSALRPALLVAFLFSILVTPPIAAQLDLSPEAETMRDAARQAGVPDADLPLRTPAESRADKQGLAPWETKLTSTVRDRLTILLAENLTAPENRHLAPQYTTPSVLIDDGARLRVECKVDDVMPFDAAFFQSIGGELVVRAEGYGLVVAWIPADQIEAFANRPDVRLIMPVHPLYPDIGSVDTEGDGIHRADLARANLGVDGTGQLVGVISDGVANIAVSQGTGDLPAGVNVVNAGSGDEGTAMLEIVHDLAPGAGLAFCTGDPGSAGMILAINSLAALPGITVITDDLPKPGEPLFEDGPIAQAKQAAVAAGVFYTASAGNRGNQHHEANFNSTASNVTIGPNTYANPHDFGSADYQLNVTLGNTNSLFLQWADPFGASGIDLDLYVVNAAGVVLASSTNPQTGTQDPNESLSFAATSGTPARIIVDYVGGGTPPTVFFDLRAFAGFTSWEYLVRAGSINGASRQTEVYAAAAADQATPNTIEGFSSRGPIQHFFPAPLTRMKPDATAVDGVSVTGAGGFGSGTCPMVNPGDCRFFGTSASTPHVAGLAALLLEAQNTLTPAQVATTFNDTAVDIDLSGPDNNAGFGRLDVYAAICEFDVTDPIIVCPANITVECTTSGGTPATHPAIAAFLAGASATDICTDAPTITHDAPTLFPVGTTTVTFTATDDQNNSASCSATVTVEDTTPPTITVDLNRYVLWPPNHRMVDILATVVVEDVCDPDPTFVLVQITSDEPDEGLGDGDFPHDIQFAAFGTPDVAFQLRSERSGLGDGRVYTILYRASDADNNTTDATVEVLVPHDRSGGAFAGGGFTNDGTAFLPGESRYSLVLMTVPAGPETPPGAEFDASRVVAGEAYVGNTAGAVRPIAHSLLDVDDDGFDDVVLEYSVMSTMDIVGASTAIDGPVGLHYHVAGDAERIDWLVNDIFTLGTPISPQTSGVEDPMVSSPLPAATALSGIYPNPFNPRTTVAFDLAEPGRVHLEVHDARGALVRVLADGDYGAGTHEIVWNGRDNLGRGVGSGIYFVHFASGSYRTSQKIVLLK